MVSGQLRTCSLLRISFLTLKHDHEECLSVPYGAGPHLVRMPYPQHSITLPGAQLSQRNPGLAHWTAALGSMRGPLPYDTVVDVADFERLVELVPCSRRDTVPKHLVVPVVGALDLEPTLALRAITLTFRPFTADIGWSVKVCRQMWVGDRLRR